MIDEYDFAVTGGGSAGYAAARTAVAAGMKTVVIDGAAQLGGLCILRGCMPSKSVIESANRFLTLRHADRFGLHAEGIEADPHRIIARKRKLVEEFAAFRVKQLESGKFDLVRGTAQFLDKETLLVGDRKIRARTSVVATGSAIAWPDVPGIRDAECLTSDDALELERIPASLVVLGGGPVALEMAHYFAALGSEVTVVQRSPHVLKSLDKDVSEALENAFRARGIQVFTDTRLVSVERSGSVRKVVFDHKGNRVEIEAGDVLQALGREPATSGLGLEKIGVGFSGKQVHTNAAQQTTVPGIYAAGDVCGPHEIVHIAIQQGEIAARNAARDLGLIGTPAETIDYRLLLFAVFTEPQVAVVGLGEEAAQAAGRSTICAKHLFADHGKSMVMAETEGFVKLVADAGTGEILGGSVVGPHASDLIHEVAVAMAFGATAAQFAAVPHYHPTLAEIWTYPAEELMEAGR